MKANWWRLGSTGTGWEFMNLWSMFLHFSHGGVSRTMGCVCLCRFNLLKLCFCPQVTLIIILIASFNSLDIYICKGWYSVRQQSIEIWICVSSYYQWRNRYFKHNAINSPKVCKSKCWCVIKRCWNIVLMHVVSYLWYISVKTKPAVSINDRPLK